MKRHPKQCIYFGSGSCKYGDSCKYNHGPDLRELLHKSLEEHKKKDNIIKMLNEKVSELEKDVEECLDIVVRSEMEQRLGGLEVDQSNMEQRLGAVEVSLEKITNILEKVTNRMNEDTLVCDDSSRELKFQKTVKNVSTATFICDDTTKEPKDQNTVKEDLVKKEIEFCVDIQRKLRMRINTIWKENFEQNRKMLENFKEDLNANFKRMTMEVSLPVNKFKQYEEEINNFNSECYKILNKKITKNDKTSIFKRTMKSNYEALIDKMIKIRNLK